MPPTIKGLDPTTGQLQHRKVFSGDPVSEATAAVTESADPTAHNLLTLVNDTVAGLSSRRIVHNYASTSATGAATAIGGASRLHALSCYNSSVTSTVFLMLFDSASVPTAGASSPLMMPIPLFADQVLMIGSELFGLGGLRFDAGLSYAFSSSLDSFTVSDARSSLRLTLFHAS